MNTKMLLAALAGGIVYFLLGWLVYGMLLVDTFAMPESVTKEPMVMWAMVVSCLIWGLLVAVVCSKWAGVKTFAGGFTVGLILGVLVSGAINFSLYSMTTLFGLNSVLMDLVVNGILIGITGGVAGIVLGMGQKSA